VVFLLPFCPLSGVWYRDLMNETVPTEPSPEEKRLQEEREEAEWLAEWLADHPESVIASEDRRESGPEIAELEQMFASFEWSHQVARLYEIRHLTRDEASRHPIREPARVALIPIIEKLTVLKKETNISSKAYEELEAKCKYFSNAVGMINKGQVDHHR